MPDDNDSSERPSQSLTPSRSDAEQPSWVSYRPELASRQAQHRRPWRILVVAIGVALIAAVAAYYLSHTSGPGQLALYEEIRQLQAEGQIDEALARIEQVRHQLDEPHVVRLVADLERELHLSVRLRAAQRLQTSGRSQQAIKELRAVLEEYPGNEKVILLLMSIERLTKTSTAPSAGKPVAAQVKSAGEPSGPNRARSAEKRRPVTSKRSRGAVRTHRAQRARARSSRALATTPKTGQLHIETDIPAAISVDGEPSGRVTPATMTLPRGVHSIEVRGLEDAQASRRQTVVVKETMRSLRLKIKHPEKEGPQARAAAKPAAAHTRPDAGASPPAAQREASASGRNAGFVSVSARPPGTVYVDGTTTGKLTPLWMHKLPPGRHVVEVRATSGSVRRKSITVRPNQITPVIFH